MGSKQIVCIYHNKDLDGYTSGAIVKRKYPDAKLIGYHYGEPFPWDEIPEGSKVIMVDVSLPMKDMFKLAYHTHWQLVWIDHHISAKKDYDEFTKNSESFLTYVYDNTISACEGTFKYLFPDEVMPESILLLGEYDTWRNQDQDRWDNVIMPFQYGMRLICTSPESYTEGYVEYLLGGSSYYLTQELMRTIRENGRKVLTYQSMLNERVCKSAFESDFKGYRAICVNTTEFNSNTFNSVYDETKHDIMIPFQYDGKSNNWRVSLYTTKDDVDCSTLAKSMGGGGHKKAAGFVLEDINKILNV